MKPINAIVVAVVSVLISATLVGTGLWYKNEKSSAPPQTLSWVTYTYENNTHSFSLDLPEQWAVTKDRVHSGAERAPFFSASGGIQDFSQSLDVSYLLRSGSLSGWVNEHIAELVLAGQFATPESDFSQTDRKIVIATGTEDVKKYFYCYVAGPDVVYQVQLRKFSDQAQNSEEVFSRACSTFSWIDQQLVDTADWKTYQNTTYEYSIKYPPSYSVSSQAQESVALFQGTQGMEGPAPNVRVADVGIDAYLDLLAAQYRTAKTQPKLLYEETVSNHGMDFKKKVFATDVGLDAVHFLWEWRGKTYDLSSLRTDTNYQVFKTMVDTFRYTGPVALDTTNWKTYISPHRYLLKYPADWKLVEVLKGSPEDFFQILAPGYQIQRTSETSSHAVNIDHTPEEYYLSRLANREEVTINGESAIQGTRAQWFSTFFQNNDETIYIYWDSDLTDPIYSQILSTFTFLDRSVDDWQMYGIDERTPEFYKMVDGKREVIPVPFQFNEYHSNVNPWGVLFYKRGPQRSETSTEFTVTYEGGADLDVYWYDFMRKEFVQAPLFDLPDGSHFERVYAVHPSSAEKKIAIEIGQYYTLSEEFKPGLFESQPEKTYGILYDPVQNKFIRDDVVTKYTGTLGVTSTRIYGIYWDSKNDIAVSAGAGEGCGPFDTLSFVDLTLKKYVTVGGPESFTFATTPCNPKNAVSPDGRWFVLYGQSEEGKMDIYLFTARTKDAPVKHKVDAFDFTTADSPKTWSLLQEYPVITFTSGGVIDFNSL